MSVGDATSHVGTPPPEGSGEGGDVPLLKWVNSLLRHRYAMIAVPLTLTVLVVGWELIQPRTYTSDASFTPARTGDRRLSQFSGIAAQFGVQVPGGGGNRSPQFYADLLTAKEVLGTVVESEYSLPGGALTENGATRGSLVDIYGIREPDSLRARAMAIESLRNSLQVRSDLETSVVRLSVRSSRPRFSQLLADRLLEAVHQFNVERRSSQASEEREFLEERLEAAEADLRAAEESLQIFLESNRRYQGSPQLRFEHDRLQRRVQMEQQIFTSLQESLEQAKTEEVRTTPVVTVVQPPTRPAIPDPRRLVLKVLVALLLGSVLAVMWALARDAFERGDWEETEHVTEFRRHLSQVRREARKVVAPVLRRIGR